MSHGESMLTKVRRFASSEEGGMTVLGLFLTMGLLVIGGLAIDTTRLQARTVMMQNTADSAAYTALQRRVFNSEAAATAAAVAVARGNMPPDIYGNAVTAADVEWGTWDRATRTFRPVANSRSAVRVTVRQEASRGNPFTNVLLGWVGVPIAEPTRVAVVMNESDRGCLREGFVAQGLVDIQSNNTFLPGFCIHSNSGVKISQNGTFTGTTVSMPDPTDSRLGGDLQLPSSGFDGNTGLQDALAPDQYELHTLSQMERIVASLRTSPSTSPFLPSYITHRTTVTRVGANPIPGNMNVSSASLKPGRVYVADCSGGNTSNKTLTITANTSANGSGVIRGVVLITNCQVRFGGDAGWEDSLLASTNTTSAAITGNSGMRIGSVDPDCTAGGGGQIMTMGSVSFPSKMTAYGAQILAKGDIGFTANGTSEGEVVRGLSLVAGGTISGTSNMIMSSCGGRGMEQNIMFPYARLVL